MEKAKGKGFMERNKEIPVKNIFMNNTDNAWKLRRRKFRHAFTQASLKGYESIMSELVERLIDKLKKAADDQEIVKLDAIFGRLALDMLFKLAFDIEENFLENVEKYNEMDCNVQTFFKLNWVPSIIPFYMFIRLLPIPLPGPLGKFRSAFNFLEQKRREIHMNLRAKYDTGGFVTDCFGKMLIEFEQENHESPRNIKSEIMIFLLAGHETTAHSMAWFVYSLCKSPEIQRKCQAALLEAEGAAVNSSSSSHPVYSIFSPLPDYIEACLKESMRKYPTVSRGSSRMMLTEGIAGSLTTKEQQRDHPGLEITLPNSFEDKKVIIPADTLIQINIYALQNDIRNWGEDVADFKPERWLTSSGTAGDGSSNSLTSIAAYAGTGKDASSELTYMPFSSGVRNCVGMNFATWEIRSVIYHLVKNFTFEFAEVELQDEKKALLTDMLTMKPLHQLPVKITLNAI